MVDDLVDLERDERGGHDGGEPFGPRLAEPEAGALGEEERSVDESAEADILEPVRGDAGELADGFVEIAGTGFEGEGCDPVFQGVAAAVVDEL